MRGADRQREPVGRRGHGAPHAPAQAQRVLLGLARALAHEVQAPRRADPRVRRGVERGARRALDLHAPQQLRPAGGHHRHAAAGQDDRRQRPLARERQRARRPVQAQAVADGQRPGVEHEEPLPGGREDVGAAGRDGDPDRRDAEVAGDHRERRRRAGQRRGGHHPEVEGGHRVAGRGEGAAPVACDRHRARRAGQRAAGRPPGWWSRRAARRRWCPWPAARRAPGRTPPPEA